MGGGPRDTLGAGVPPGGGDGPGHVLGAASLEEEGGPGDLMDAGGRDGRPERLVPGGFWTFAKKEQGGRDLELDLLIPRSVGS